MVESVPWCQCMSVLSLFTPTACLSLPLIGNFPQILTNMKTFCLACMAGAVAKAQGQRSSPIEICCQHCKLIFKISLVQSLSTTKETPAARPARSLRSKRSTRSNKEEPTSPVLEDPKGRLDFTEQGRHICLSNCPLFGRGRLKPGRPCGVMYVWSFDGH